MSLWMVRAGKHGEYERKFLEDNRVYLTWGGLQEDLSEAKKDDIQKILKDFYPDDKDTTLANWRGQIWAFVSKMQAGDWVVLPSKLKQSVVQLAEITGTYTYDPKATDPYYHYRTVKWLATDIPRSNFDQDILYSFGALSTVCRIERNDAEKRIRSMVDKGWKTEPIEGEPPETMDLELLARDDIAKLIARRFKGHGLTHLVDAILRAQGYTTYVSPEGPDKGIDILASPGPLGFGNPRICVQVKSTEAQVDSATLNQLIGSMQNVKADQGLLVSWSGFKASVEKERPSQFFRVRLWDQTEIIDALLENYDKIDEDFRAELPLKRIWTLTEPENEE